MATKSIMRMYNSLNVVFSLLKFDLQLNVSLDSKTFLSLFKKFSDNDAANFLQSEFRASDYFGESALEISF